tara:strand:+ start:5620 stop:5898 length:279 start_codon:yes stop_codon:yes gene_type:complete
MSKKRVKNTQELKIIDNKEKTKEKEKGISKSPTFKKWEKYFGKNMELKVGSKTFIGTVTNLLWLGGHFLELNNGEAVINANKIEYAISINEA